MNHFFNKVVDIFFPRRCVDCESHITQGKRNFICSQCWSQVSLITPPFCTLCGIPFVSKDTIPEGYLCGQCRRKRPYFNTALSFAVYDGAIKELLHQYKYNKKIGIADDLFTLVEDFSERVWHTRMNAVIHVPLHKDNLRDRGFDQSFVLAKKISSHFRLPSIADNVVRIKKTVSQVGLSKPKRIENTQGAFMVKRPAELKGKNILLIDDVMTTGATVNECAKVLKKAGVQSISVLTVARTIF